MAEKFSIINRIDIKKLDERINKFRQEKGYNPYIFMNIKTMEEIKNFVGLNSVCFIMTANEYKGYKVFENSELYFGEIELR